jgi:hypothetical protein
MPNAQPGYFASVSFVIVNGALMILPIHNWDSSMPELLAIPRYHSFTV